ncbi:MAG TPA: CYTH and CHAD domain-containing protein [Jiangellales bacterium]|nr:CYTH and CHAD domain-containing protein [Jiangellales bacterium]
MSPKNPQQHREVERKFRVHGLFRLPELTVGGVTAVCEHGTDVLEATYHDTEDLRLAREGVTLRNRTGGADEGWHLKVPVPKADPGVRDELRLPLDAGARGEPPEELLSLVRVIVRDLQVRPVATLRTERTTRLLLGKGEAPLAELVDDTVSVVAADGHVAARFRELELEEAAGAPEGVAEALQPLVDALLAGGAVAGEFVSKAVRALGPLASRPAEVAEPPDTGPGDPAREAIRAHLARHTRALRLADMAVRRDAEDSVHQMRVATRRLRSGLRVFRPLLDRTWADDLRAELGWVAAALGGYRDREVLLARLDEHVGELPEELPVADVRALLRRRLRREMTEARKHALETLGSERYLALHDTLVAACADPPTLEDAERPAGEVLPPLVKKAWKRLSRDADKLLADESDGEGAPDEEWHTARKAAKKARYSVEACVPVFGDEAAALAKQLSRVTEVLGEHQDGAVAAEAVRGMAATGRVGPGVAFALGVLHEVERDHVERTRSQFAELWPEVRRPRLRKWLEG